jgi:hypothetical protein
MKMTGGPASVNIKLALLAIAIIIAAGTLIYTQNLVKDLHRKERQIVELYAKSLEYIADSDIPNADFTFIFENIIKRIDFPLILTDANDKVKLDGMGGGVRNLTYDSTASREELNDFFDDKIEELREINDPITVTYSDSVVLGKIYYGDSDLVKKLTYYPYLQIFFAVLFILISYVGFSYLKRNEQSNIWVGMAKETAHQLGTPISSLMGWAEILKLSYKDPDKVLDTADEMGRDLERLNKITKRFSKIGSKPELKETEVYHILNNVRRYIERRLPQTGKKVDFNITGDTSATVKLNDELFEWVIENLAKNALDAIEKEEGHINFKIIDGKDKLDIEVEDNGKGIDLKRRKDVFRPGYSTKKRGWGLGLSLSKRIIDEYHNGKIFVKNSVIGEGTTFKISLRK